MQVFNSFFKIAKKRMHSFMIYFGIFAGIILISSFTYSDNVNSKFESSQLNVYIDDRDQSQASEALIAYLSGIHKVDQTGKTDTELADLIYYRMLDYVLVIPEGFEEQILEGSFDNLFTSKTIPGSNRGTFVNNQIGQYMATLQIHLAAGESLEDAIAATDDSIEGLPEVEVLGAAASAKQENSVVFAFFQYQPYVFILILFVGMAPILVTHGEKNIKARTISASITSRDRTLQLTLASSIFAILVFIAFQVFGVIVFRQDFFTHNVLLALLNSFVFIIFAGLLTFVVSLFAPNDNAVNMIANSVGLGMSFLCGIFVPQSMLGEGVLKVARFLPAYWYIQNNNMLSGQSTMTFSYDYYFQCLGIQLLFAVATFVVLLSLTNSRHAKMA